LWDLRPSTIGVLIKLVGMNGFASDESLLIVEF